MNPNHAAARVLAEQADRLQDVALVNPQGLAAAVRALAEVLRATPHGPDPTVDQVADLLAAHATTVTFHSGADCGWRWRCACQAAGTAHWDARVTTRAAALHMAAVLCAALNVPVTVPAAGEKAGT